MKWLLTVAAVVWLLSGEAWAQVIRDVYPEDSIQEAIDDSQSGDLVLVHVWPYSSSTWYEALTLKSGVDVLSTDGSGATIIDATNVQPPPDAAVYGAGRQDLEFGAADQGFTVRGGTNYGLQLDGCSNVDVEDVTVMTQASDAGVYCTCDDYTLHLYDVDVDMGNTSPFAGWILYGCWLHDCSVKNVGTVGIWTEGPVIEEDFFSLFLSVDISNCPIGLYAEDINVYWVGGDISGCSDMGFDVEEWAYRTSVEINGVSFDNCGTALRAYAGYYPPNVSVEVWADGCTFRDSDYGTELVRAEGFVKNCNFWDIGATGLTVTDYGNELDIGYPNEGNTFYRVDGTGIELGSGARVAIVDNEFARVLGTGILCNTGAADTIDACDLDGFDAVVPEYSYEGIHTEGSGTMVRIRNNDVWDYEDEPSPTPRAVYVRGYFSGTTADLGRNLPLGQWGYNDFRNTGIDVYYTGVVGQGQPIPDLYAQRNYWGGADPWLDGTWEDYVIWEPDLDSPPGAPPAGGDLSSAPERVALANVRPNPAVGRAQFSYELPAPGAAEVALWDLRGHRVKTLIQEGLRAGTGTVEWDGTDEAGNPVASGAYLCRLKSSHGQATRRFVFMR